MKKINREMWYQLVTDVAEDGHNLLILGYAIGLKSGLYTWDEIKQNPIINEPEVDMIKTISEAINFEIED